MWVFKISRLSCFGGPQVTDAEAQVRRFSFLKADSSPADQLGWPDGAKAAREDISEALNAQNIAFLLGAGCSSLIAKGEEVGVPTMGPLAMEFTRVREIEEPGFPTTSERQFLSNHFGVEISSAPYTKNLERLMEVLYSLRFSLERSTLERSKARLEVVNSVIRKVQGFLFARCTSGPFSSGDESVVSLYMDFYRRLVLRDRSLPRPWVFTTNYDLFNETAMDRLGLPYANGFSGVVERRFNPATYRYALAEQLDSSDKRWSAVDGFVYLCKLHGSVSWTEDGHGLFPFRELVAKESSGEVMIYPTPAKQGSTLGSPYADLFREFQSRIVRGQSVLFTMGYGFGDEHINSIIYQALTIPTFRLIVFADPEQNGVVADLIGLRDPRVWVIGGAGPEQEVKAHYFRAIVEHFMPQRPLERVEGAIRKILETRVAGSSENP